MLLSRLPPPLEPPPPPQYTLNCGGACSRLYGCRRSCERILHIARNPIKYPLQCRCGATHFPPTTIPHPMPCVSFAYRFIAKQHHRYLLYLQTPRSPIDCVRGMYWGGDEKHYLQPPSPCPTPRLVRLLNTHVYSNSHILCLSDNDTACANMHANHLTGMCLISTATPPHPLF